MSRVFTILLLAVLTVTPPVAAQDSQPVPAPLAEANLLEIPTDELRLWIAPLDEEELGALRDQLVDTLREEAGRLAELLVLQRRRESGNPDEEQAAGDLDARVTEGVTRKVELVSRLNAVFDAIETRGGDVKAGRAYLKALDQLRPEAEPPVDQVIELSAEEQARATVRDRAAELIAIVRAEPPVHERPNPWEVPVSELELELQPLTLEEIEQRLAAWQQILQREVRKRIRYDILLNNAEKLAGAREQRASAALLAGLKLDDPEISLEQLKGVLAEQSQAQQQIVLKVVERMETAIKLVQRRGGDPSRFTSYISSATGQKLNLYDPTVLYAQVRAWVFSQNGGVAVGLNMLKFIAVLAAFWAASLFLGWVANAAMSRIRGASSLLRPLFVKTIKRVTLIVGFITALSMLGVNSGPLLAMIGAAGLVVGLALQGTLSNFASGILILLTKPYDVGDVIDAGGVVGKVEAMNLVSTSVLTFDNQAMLVPNNQIWNGVITNITGRSTRRVDLTFGIGYGDDIGKAVSILEEMVAAHAKVLDNPAPVIKVHELGDNSVNLIARPWCRTGDYWDVFWDLMRDVKLRFDQEGINIPFPQRDLHLPGPIEVRLADDRQA